VSNTWGMTTDRADDWRDNALCRPTVHRRPEMFYPLGLDKGYTETPAIGAAKAFCRPCPVRAQCLAHALVRKEEWGIWGGLTPAERRAMLRNGYTPAPVPARARPKPRLRWCVNCPRRFEPTPDWPKGRLCASCRMSHTDRRIRSHAEVAS